MRQQLLSWSVLRASRASSWRSLSAAHTVITRLARSSPEHDGHQAAAVLSDGVADVTDYTIMTDAGWAAL
jgi:hypothetical protein